MRCVCVACTAPRANTVCCSGWDSHHRTPHYSPQFNVQSPWNLEPGAANYTYRPQTHIPRSSVSEPESAALSCGRTKGETRGGALLDTALVPK